MKKVRWGILGTAKIAEQWLIPAMHKSRYAEVVAVASRDLSRAENFAQNFGLSRAFGSYEELLRSEEVDAIYNALPNHLHVPWSIEAIDNGKHVLCEKPLGLNEMDAQKLLKAADARPNLVVMEAFMYRFHPQWLRIKELLNADTIGSVRQVQANFTYFNRDPKNVRNRRGIGGGGLLDIGCYCISVSRLAFGREPVRVAGTLQFDDEFKVDSHVNALLDFANGWSSFYCSTQSQPSQMVNIIGEHGRIFVDTPFYGVDRKECELVLQSGQKQEVLSIGQFDHYVLQVDAFCQAVQHGKTAPTPLRDALANMRVIDAIFASHERNQWVKIG